MDPARTPHVAEAPARRAKSISCRPLRELAQSCTDSPTEQARCLDRQRWLASRPAPDPFIGRAAELHDLCARLERGERLITLWGPAGIGKTRLAQELLQHLWALPDSQPNLVFCDLAEARDLEELCSVVARAADVPLPIGQSLDQVTAKLGRNLGQQGAAVLVLDNFEQLVEPGASTLASWLREAPQLQLVVTSRERLRVRGEQCFEIGPLPLPVDDESDGDAIAASEAVQLLLCRARAVRAEFVLCAPMAAVAADIVRRVDGIPLAIELCAARLGLFGPRELLAQLSTGLDVLSHGPRDAGHRQATLRAALEWSWTLLSVTEQSALAQCSLFRGGFCLAAAVAVIEPPTGPNGKPKMRQVADALQGLLDRSLLRAAVGDPRTGELRYGMLEVVRELAAEKLTQGLEVDRAALRHAEYYLASFEATERPAPGLEGLLQQAQDADNLVAAAERLVKQAPQDRRCGELALRAVLALEPFVLIGTRDRLASIGKLVDQASEAATEAPGVQGLRARALCVKAEADIFRGRFDDAGRGIIEALQRAEASGEAAARVVAASSLALALIHWDRDQEARLQLERVHDLVFANGQPKLEAIWQVAWAAWHIWRGEPAEAADRARQAIELFRRAGDVQRECAAQGQLLLALLNLAEYDEVERHCTDTLATLRSIKDKRIEGYILGILGRAQLVEGRLSEAQQALEAARRIHQAVDDLWYEGYVTGMLGSLAWERGQEAEAARCFRQSVELQQRHADTRGAPGSLRCFEERLLGLTLARYGMALAGCGRLADARVQLDRAERHRSNDPADPIGLATAMHEGHLDLARARQAHDSEEARALVAIAHGRLAAMDGDGGYEGPPTDLAAKCFELRLAIRALRQVEQALPPRLHPANACGTLVIGPEGRWFRWSEAPAVDLSRRPVARLILLRLVDQRCTEPESPLPLAEIVAAGWPGERISAAAAANRAYVSLTRLRKLGLRGVLQNRDGGFLLDPAVPLRRSSEG